MHEGDAAFEDLRAAIEELAAGQADELVHEALVEARAKVRSILAEAMAQALLDHSGEALGAEARSSGRLPGTRSAAGGPREGRPPRRADEEAPAAAAPERRGREAASAPPPDSAERTAATGDGEPSAPVSAAPPDRPKETGSGWYVYCVIADERIDLSNDARGVDPAEPVTVIAAHGLAAVASRVSLAEFGEVSLRENLNDIAWLEEKARAHEAVLDAALARTTIVPMRLCTLYSSEASIREMLERERPRLVDALERLEGKAEWGVKVFVDRTKLEAAVVEGSEELRALRTEVAALPEGEAYMKHKRLDALRREQADDLSDRCADRVHERVAARADEAVLNPLVRAHEREQTGDMVLNGVYLVPDRGIEDFRAALSELEEELGQLGFSFQVTGPWPAYNFVTSSTEAAR
jgi:hypothetical protein